jgi:hypothetical protein
MGQNVVGPGRIQRSNKERKVANTRDTTAGGACCLEERTPVVTGSVRKSACVYFNSVFLTSYRYVFLE